MLLLLFLSGHGENEASLDRLSSTPTSDILLQSDNLLHTPKHPSKANGSFDHAKTAMVNRPIDQCWNTFTYENLRMNIFPVMYNSK